MIGPRAVLTSTAVGFISASAAASISPRVSGVSGACRVTISERRSSSSQRHRLHPGGDHHLRIDIGIGGHDRQIERFGAGGDGLPDAAEADDPQRLLAQRLDGTAQDAPCRRSMLDPGPLAQRAVLLDDAPVEGQNHGQGVVGHFRRAVAGVVGDHDAGVGRGVEIDVVESHAVAGDDFHPRDVLQHTAGDGLARAHQQRVGVLGGADQIILAGAGAPEQRDVEIGDRRRPAPAPARAHASRCRSGRR